jgi:intein/homing endonuclease
VYLADKNEYVKIQSLVGKTFKTISLDQNYKLVKSDAICAVNGKEECFDITLRSGKTVSLTDNHPLLKIEGWTEVKDLKVGDRVATARKMPEGHVKYSTNKARLLGYFIGDGGITLSPTFTNETETILKDFQYIISHEYPNLSLSKYNPTKSKATTFRVSSNCKGNNVTKWLRQLDLMGRNSHTKFIPKECFNWNNEAVANLIGAYYDCDGTIIANAISFTSVSERLVKDVQRLLLKFGILSNIKKRKTSWKYKEIKKHSKAFALTISGQENVQLFVKHIPTKTDKLDRLVLDKISNANLDTIPKEVWDIYENDFGVELRSRKHGRCYRKQYSPSREKLSTFADDFEIEDAKTLAESDMYWDEIVSIESVGIHETYAVEVHEYHNYLVDTVITHNTTQLAMFSILKAMLFPYSKIGIIGPSFRQTKFLFDAIEEIYQKSPFVREATTKVGIRRGNDSARLDFHNGSFIEGLPIGSKGDTIRGRRYTVAILDEFNYHNKETIEKVVEPFLIIKKSERPNQMVIASTPGYKTEHFWDEYKRHSYKSKIQPELYTCTFFNFIDVLLSRHKEFQPDMDKIKDAYDKNPINDWLMEYGGYFPSDSAAYFPPELISACEPRINPITLEKRGDPNSEYVMGIDPARSDDGDNFAISIIKLMPNNCRHVVKVIAGKGIPFPKQVDLIRGEIHHGRFNVTKICMDAGGGGMGLRDLLMQQWHDKVNNAVQPPITELKNVLDKENWDSTKILPILSLVTFTIPTIDEMYTSLRADMEHEKIQFPITIRRDLDPRSERMGKELALLKSEMQHLTPKPTSRGMTFLEDSRIGKDRITSLVLSNMAANLLYKKELGLAEEDQFAIPTGFWAK